ncbi:oligosaccharide flippase family protein [Thermodesulfobacteriota bacterium]
MAKYFVYILIAFFLTPFIIDNIGTSQYGLLVVVLSLVGYAGILEMGVQSAIVKLVAQYAAEEEKDKVNEIFVTAFFFFLIIGLLSAVVFWFVIPPLTPFLLKDVKSLSVVNKLLVIFGFDLIVVFLKYVFSGFIYGLQIYHVKNFVDTVSGFLNAILIFFLLPGGSILIIAGVKLFVDIVTAAALFILCRKAYPSLKINFSNVSKQSFHELLRFGGKIFASATMVRIANNFDPLIITYYLTTTWTAIFAIPRRLVDYLKEISWAFTTGFMPAFSELQGKNDLETIRAIYLRYTRYIIILIFPVVIAVMVYGVPFIRLWVGEEFADKGSILVSLLAGAFAVESFQPLLWRLFIGVGRLNILVKVSAATSAAYIIMALILVKFYGINGIGVSALLIAFFNQSIFLFYACEYMRISKLEYFMKCHFAPLSISLFFGCALYGLSQLFPPVSYMMIMMQFAAVLPLYAALVYFFALGQDEKEHITIMMRRYVSEKI